MNIFQIKNRKVGYSRLITYQLSLFQAMLPDCDDNEDDTDDGIDELDGARSSLGLRNGPCGDVVGVEASLGTSEDDENPLSTSLEPKYFSQSFHQDQEDSDDGWNNCPENLELEFQKGLIYSIFSSQTF